MAMFQAQDVLFLRKSSGGTDLVNMHLVICWGTKEWEIFSLHE